MASYMRDFQGVCKIFSASCRDFNDIVSLYGLNSSFQLIKLKKHFKEHLPWRLDKIRIINRKCQQQMQVHKQLPFVLQIMNNNEIYFYVEEQTSKQIVKNKELKLLGSYSIHSSSRYHSSKIPIDTTIVRAKWVKNMAQVIVQYSNNSIGLVSSHTQLRILSQEKYPEEYGKIWKEKSVQSGEKWERLFEIKFGTELGYEQEQIVDFEVLDTKTQDENFLINIVIFTSSMQYYVYQTETKFLQGLKTISSTTQLMSSRTDDQILQILCSNNNINGQTMLVVKSEQDPTKIKAKPQSESKVIEEFEEDDDDDDDDGDIFAQFTTKPKKYVKKSQSKKQEIEEAPLKHCILLKLISFQDKQGKSQQIHDEWKLELPLEFKHKQLISKMNEEFIALMVEDDKTQDKIIYMYEILTQRYIGFINLSEVLQIPTKDVPLDFLIADYQLKGSLVIIVVDTLYLISQGSKEAQPGKWTVIEKQEGLSGIDRKLIKKVQVCQSPYSKLIFEINGKYYETRNNFARLRNEQKNENMKTTLNQLFSQSQKSLALFDDKFLKALYVKGYGNLILKILVKLKELLLNVTENAKEIGDFLDFDLEQIMNEIIENQNAMQQQTTGKQDKKQTASSMFDDIYSFSEPEEKKKSEEEQKPQEKKIDVEFDECYEQLLQLVREKGKSSLNLNQVQLDNLQIFIKKFKSIYKKDFYSDTLTSILLREVYFESVEVEINEDKKEIPRAIGGAFNVQDFLKTLKQEQVAIKIGGVKSWDSFKCCAALHSENQDVIFNEISEKFDFENNLNWEMVKKLCLPVWLKETTKLRQIVEKVAKGEYKISGEDFGKSSKAERTAAWYIMLNKKNILLTLYKAEPAYKKVHDMLLNDFTDKRWKTAAEKNAMILMSQKKYMFSIAFFLLAGSVQSAVQVAIGRLNDPILAILICRIMEGEESEEMKAIYQEQFIDRGEKFNDPYLVNIGRWQRKEYLKAVNHFAIDNSKQSNITNMFNSSLENFNLYQKKEQAKQDETVIEILPKLSSYSHYVLDCIKVLKKAPAIKRLLNKNWEMDKGLGESIFDDFYGDTQAQSQKKEEKKEESKLMIDESKILTVTTYDASQQGFAVVSLIILNENQEFTENVDDKYKERIIQSLLLDMIMSLQANPDINTSVKKLKSSIQFLAGKFYLEQKTLKEFVLHRLQFCSNMSLKIAFLLEDQKGEVIYSLEDETLKLLDSIYAFTDFPFLFDPSQEQQVKKSIIPLINTLEQILECMIMLDFQEPSPASPSKSKQQSDFINTSNKKRKVSMTIADPENEEGNFQFSLDEDRGTVILKKIRISLLIYLALIQMSYATKKFAISKDLISELRTLLSYNFEKAKEQNITTSLVVNYQRLKIKIQKFKYMVLKNEVKNEDEDFESTFDVVDGTGSKPHKHAVNHKKIQDFMTLWIRYILIFNTQFVMETCYNESKIQNLINVRPSIIKIRKMNEVIRQILNPSLRSHEILKKFSNMHRILENVLTYYFENILNIQERQLVTDQLRVIDKSNFESGYIGQINFLTMFNSHQKFKKFAAFMDIKTFIQHLKDHDTSLIYHTNHDYSSYTVDKTSELFQGGIEIFKQKGEPVNSFAFDNCGKDLISLALLSKGIREIPILKTLLYRNRQNNGREIVDEEQQTWNECLHRYDMYSKEHADIKSKNEPVNAAVDKLYYYKTINYTKKARRKRGVLFLDYAMSPPETWSGQKWIEYTKPRSSLDISHEDYSYYVESHPFLPIYVTGNSKGLMCSWNYEQQEDRSVDQWITETDSKNANPKKTTIKKIRFNNYGDKIVANNMEGSIFMFRFDTYESSKMAPIFNLKKTKDMKFNDFDFLNNDTVLAMTSLKPKHIWIYDTLIPQRNGLVQEFNVGGNILQQNKARNQLYTFNEKPGQMNVIDLKMNKVVSTLSMSNEEVTAVCMNEAQDSLVLGFKDGTIKILNSNKDFEVKESYMAFSQFAGKKGSVAQLRVHPDNGALYASSQTGSLKLFRTKV